MIDVSDTDVPNLIEYDLVDGNKLRVERRDPYGHWFFVLSKGLLPDQFKGGYTSRFEVRKAVEAYAQYRDVALGLQPPRPEIKFKKVK